MMRPLRLTTRLIALAVVALPASAQWGELSMPQPQSSMGTAKAGPYLLFAGERNATDLVQAFDTTTGTWVSSQPLSVPRQALRGVTVGSRAVFSGGSAANTLDGLTTIDVYDSAAGPPSDPAAWSTLDMPSPRNRHATAAIGSKVFFARGMDGGANGVASADIYDFATGTWTIAPLNGGGSGAAAVVVGSKVLIAGGLTQSAATDVVDIYDDATGTWSTATLSEARGGGAAGRIGATSVGSLAIFAGGLRDWFGGGWSTTVDIYDDATGMWSTAQLSRARDGVAVASVGGRVIFAGGDIAAGPGSIDAVDVLDLASGEWSTTRLASYRRSGDPLVVADTIYFAGGFEGSSAFQSDRVETYTAPELLISVTGGGPDSFDRLGATVPVEIVEQTPGALVPGSPTLHYDVGAGEIQVPMTMSGPGAFVAAFPTFECGTAVSWYVSAASTGGTAWTFPGRAPDDVIVSVAADPVPVFEFRMDAVDGWTVGAPTDNASAGLWERGDPVATETQAEFDHTPGPGGECWVTGIGVPFASPSDHDVDGGRTSLFTPVLDLTDVPDPQLGYWRWLYADAVQDDLLVEITSDGADWIQVERIQGNGFQSRGGWFRKDVRLLDVPGLELTDSMQVRFVARDRFQENRVEVLIDDVVISGCSTGPGGVYCNSVPNSTGVPSSLAATGSRAVLDNDVTLVATDLPQNAFGLFLCSLDRDVTPGSGGSTGVLCLGGSIGRYVGPGQIQNSGPSGAFDLTLDLAMTPTPVGFVSIAPGETWHFQTWHRDSGPSGATSNFTDGYLIPFE